jgi:hypothetical protein
MYFPATATPHGPPASEVGEVRGMARPGMNWPSTPVPSAFALPIVAPLAQ